jgi:alkylation response protein AidB-like acyl-CoA dehydrogenase
VIADSWIDIEALRLMTPDRARKIDHFQDYNDVLSDVSAIKAATQRVLQDLGALALQIDELN